MRKIISISLPLVLLAMGLIGAGVASAGESNVMDPELAASSPPPSGPTSQTYNLVFSGPGDTHSFYVEKAQKAGDLTVDTMDCCIVGDNWTVTLNPDQPKNKDTSGTGDGNTSTFSGAATVHPWVRGTVTVSYDAGVDIWPAGMTVRFTYSQPSKNNTGMNITPLP
jgi:hypothetical protein